jgi:catechol 2,3-dioxygenase-like lactoylglutathione lyase family enzyme
MALNGLLDIELSVPDPAALGGFWERHGLLRTADGVYGTADRPVQLRIAESDHRHLSELHLSCEHERDLADIATRLADLGVDAVVDGTTLRCIDPVLGHTVRIDVGGQVPLTGSDASPLNRPGRHVRVGGRTAAPDTPGAPPRRVGHVVLGSPDIALTTRFYIDALGYRVSDQTANAFATFCRVESDHHNLLIHRAPVGHLNHYALEMDDIDAIGRTGTQVTREGSATSVVGIGRHYLGSNVFWYLRDPSGTMFELFCDMDQIVDDEAWEHGPGRRDWGADGTAPPFNVWGPSEPPEFFRQPDLPAIAAAREARGLR